jgi:hypothetical protein
MAPPSPAVTPPAIRFDPAPSTDERGFELVAAAADEVIALTVAEVLRETDAADWETGTETEVTGVLLALVCIRSDWLASASPDNV